MTAMAGAELVAVALSGNMIADAEHQWMRDQLNGCVRRRYRWVDMIETVASS